MPLFSTLDGAPSASVLQIQVGVLFSMDLGGGVVLPKKGPCAYKPQPGTWVGPDVLSSHYGQTSWDSASQTPKQRLIPLLTPCNDSLHVVS